MTIVVIVLWIFIGWLAFRRCRRCGGRCEGDIECKARAALRGSQDKSHRVATPVKENR